MTTSSALPAVKLEEFALAQLGAALLYAGFALFSPQLMVDLTRASGGLLMVSWLLMPLVFVPVARAVVFLLAARRGWRALLLALCVPAAGLLLTPAANHASGDILLVPWLASGWPMSGALRGALFETQVGVTLAAAFCGFVVGHLRRRPAA